MTDIKYNERYDAPLRCTLRRYRKIKNMTDAVQRREFLDLYADDIKDARRRLRQIGQAPDHVVIPDKDDYESVTIIYKDPFEFDGTKQELDEYLWENHATRIFSDYDCTGKPFTRGFIIGHIGGNLWKIGERMGVDV